MIYCTVRRNACALNILVQLTMAIKLYGFPPSHATRRVALIFKELALPYELVPVDMLKDEHKAAPYLAHQPFGQVPYIDDGGFQLFESRAIARYLVTKYGGAGQTLLPGRADVEAWARFEQAASVELSNFDPYMNALSWEVIFKKCVPAVGHSLLNVLMLVLQIRWGHDRRGRRRQPRPDAEQQAGCV